MKTGEPAMVMEASTKEKIAYLKAHLHPSTVEYLEPMNFMLDQPFPYDEIEERWFDEADDENPPIPATVVKHDREVWLAAR